MKKISENLSERELKTSLSESQSYKKKEREEFPKKSQKKKNKNKVTRSLIEMNENNFHETTTKRRIREV